MSEQEQPIPAEPEVVVSDSDFTVESASVPFEQPPADTTAKPAAAAQAEATTPAEDATAEVTADESQAASEQVAETQTDARSRDERTGQFKKAKKKSPEDRIAEYTYKAREAERQLDAERRERAEERRQREELQRRLEAIERGERAPAAKAEDKPAGPPPMPEPPEYTQFATDDEYRAAIAKWRGDMVEWQGGREKALQEAITNSLDDRLKNDRTRSAAMAEESAFVGRIASARNKHADWDERAENLKDLRSSWYDPTKHGDASTPFLSDLARNHPNGEDVLYWLGEDAERAQALADLRPTRPIRDALVLAPSAALTTLLSHFSTEVGAREFEGLKRMHPGQVPMALGILSARLAAPSGSAVPARHSITAAVPPARPPAGSPGARSTAAADAANESFEAWHERLDREERAERLRRAGVTA